MNTREVMSSHVSDGSYWRCPVCRGIIDRDHEEAMSIEARMLAETFTSWGTLVEPTGFAVVS